MAEITEKDLGDVMSGIVRRADAELLALTETELAARWYFKHEPEQSLAWNIYQFSDALESFKRSCRRWEEHHHGHMCVVECVRDKYLMPKIKELERLLKTKE